MEPSGRNRRQPIVMRKPRKRLEQVDPQPVATHGNRFAAHGREDVCHRLPPVADDPLLVREGSISWLRKESSPANPRAAGLDSQIINRDVPSPPRNAQP
jgi:hypothetical protein